MPVKPLRGVYTTRVWSAVGAAVPEVGGVTDATVRSFPSSSSSLASTLIVTASPAAVATLSFAATGAVFTGVGPVTSGRLPSTLCPA